MLIKKKTPLSHFLNWFSFNRGKCTVLICFAFDALLTQIVVHRLLNIVWSCIQLVQIYDLYANIYNVGSGSKKRVCVQVRAMIFYVTQPQRSMTSSAWYTLQMMTTTRGLAEKKAIQPPPSPSSPTLRDMLASSHCATLSVKINILLHKNCNLLHWYVL